MDNYFSSKRIIDFIHLKSQHLEKAKPKNELFNAINDGFLLTYILVCVNQLIPKISETFCLDDNE